MKKETKEHLSLGYGGGCHLGTIGKCRFCGKALYESWGPSGYRLWHTGDGKRHSKQGCNICDPIWLRWTIWEIIGSRR
jgi:hypothetical protein